MRSLVLLFLLLSCRNLAGTPLRSRNPFGFIDDTARVPLKIARHPNGTVTIEGVEAAALVGVRNPVARPWGRGVDLVSDARGGPSVLWDTRTRTISPFGWIAFVHIRGAGAHDSLLRTTEGALLGLTRDPKQPRVFCTAGFSSALLRHEVLEVMRLDGDALAIDDIHADGTVERERLDIHGWHPVSGSERGQELLLVRPHGHFGPAFAGTWEPPTAEVGVLNRSTGALQMLGTVSGCQYPAAMNCCDVGYLEPPIGWSDGADLPRGAPSCGQSGLLFGTPCVSYTIDPRAPEGRRVLTEHPTCPHAPR